MESSYLSVINRQAVAVDVCAANKEEAEKAARMFETLFGFAVKEGSSSFFAGDIELMKEPYMGKNGHIAIATHTLPRAIAYFKSRGYEFREETVTDKAAYFKDEIAGFAVHLVQR